MMTSAASWPTETREIQTAIFDSTRWNSFEHRDGDAVIVTWSKAGTTWMQQIVCQLFRGAPDSLAGFEDSPWLDFRHVPLDIVARNLAAQPGRRCIKTHLPVDAIPFSPRAKYLHVGRDTRDIVWSAYEHQASFTREALELFNGLPDRVAPLVTRPPCDVRGAYHYFLEHGQMPGITTTDFWAHVQGWWNVRSLPNVLLVHFNDLRADLNAEARRVAAFLEVDIDAARWPALLEHCSFEYMHRAAGKMQELDRIFVGGGQSLVNKGTNGRWRDMLTREEVDKCDEVATKMLTPDCARWLKAGRNELPNEEAAA
jgi:aryl sulfotransferase